MMRANQKKNGHHIKNTVFYNNKAYRSAACCAFVLSLSLAAGGMLNSMTNLYTVNAYAATEDAKTEIQNSRDRINDNKRKIEELNSKKNNVDEKIAELNRLKSDAANYIARLDGELAGIDSQIKALEAEISDIEAQIKTTEAELEKAREDEQNQYSSMKLRIKYMYERGNQSLWDALFKSGSFSEMLNKAEYISNVSDYDRKKLNEFVDTKHKIEAKEEELQSEKNVLTESNNKLSEQKNDIEKLQNDKQTELANYNTKINSAEGELSEMNSDIAGIKKAIQAEESNIASMEAKIRAEEEAARKKAEANGETYTTKAIGDIYFKWPCPSSSRITSSFGDRESPTEGASTNHKGIDIGASSGSSVIAAASGTVVISTYSASAGNYVMISHGAGVYSVYMHMSSISVSSGEEVSAGQTIGAVGSTGYSTGPHLHFGIRVNGSYVNPLSYVSP